MPRNSICFVFKLGMPETGDLKAMAFVVEQSTFSYGDLIANIIDF